MRTVVKISFALLLIAYPFLVYYGMALFDLRILAVLLMVTAVGRLAGVLALTPSPAMRVQGSFAALALLTLAGASFLLDSPTGLHFYPVLLNALLFVVFAVSLARPPSLVERLARITDPDLPPSGVAYTRKVTVVWCLFFVLNGTASCLTALSGDREVWVFYNGFLAYILMGTLFAVEYSVRLYVKRQAAL